MWDYPQPNRGHTRYEKYVKLQTSAPINKPYRYHLTEQKTIDRLIIRPDQNKSPKSYSLTSRSIVDIGCGIGMGLWYLQYNGYNTLTGFELRPEKVEIARQITGNDQIYQFDPGGPFNDPGWSLPQQFDVFYLSHSFEHFYDPERAVAWMKHTAKPEAKFFFIMPYPDRTPAPAHTASRLLGLDQDDEGATLIKWFMARGLVPFAVPIFSSEREPEIWLSMKKEEE